MDWKAKAVGTARARMVDTFMVMVGAMGEEGRSRKLIVVSRGNNKFMPGTIFCWRDGDGQGDEDCGGWQ